IVLLIRRARADQQHGVRLDPGRGRNVQAAVRCAAEAAVLHRLGQGARGRLIQRRSGAGEGSSFMHQHGENFCGAGRSDEFDFHETDSRPEEPVPATLEFAMVAATVSSGRPDVYYMARIAPGCNTFAADYTTFPAL